MFDKRFSTASVAADIPLDTQLVLWGLIDSWKSKGYEVDYLQVFELSIVEFHGKTIQKVAHRQEVPPRKEEFLFALSQPMNERLWIVDNGDEEGNAVLMRPSEY